jgi:2',3'-cyclic-nucleotide 2'-phosphodiesterase (5'-nucleotidase family)
MHFDACIRRVISRRHGADDGVYLDNDFELRFGPNFLTATDLDGIEVPVVTTIDILPFDNYVSVVNDVTPQGLKDMLENAVSRWEFGDGRFLQIANFRFAWDPRQPATEFSTAARTMDDVTSSGSRVQRIASSSSTVR